ncbi:MAG TPA: glycosyltransferase [Actinomycetota bacterium]|nr:glycosyltransferase [Actinomycetota bacterium]
MDSGSHADAPVPEVSVIIPAFNAEDTLALQLGALTDQAGDFTCEILVCDNGSTDGTADLVRDWERRFPIIRLIDASARRGPAAARNIGAAAARAPRLAFCDADDLIGSGWLALIRSKLDEHEFVAGSFDFALLNEGIDTPGLWSAQASGLTRKPYLPQFEVAGSGNMGVRTAAFRHVEGFFEGLRTAEDDDFCLRMQLSGHALAFVPELRLNVRRRGGVRELCRQAYAYAAGERRLQYRYAAFAAAASQPVTESPQQIAASETSWLAVPARTWELTTRAFRKALAIRRPADVAAIGWRWSWRLGWLLTSEDPAIPRVHPDQPASLLASWSGPASPARD